MVNLLLGGGGGDPNCFLVEIRLYVKFQLPMLLRIGKFIVGDKNISALPPHISALPPHISVFHRNNGFISLQLELRLELGLRLRLTACKIHPI